MCFARLFSKQLSDSKLQSQCRYKKKICEKTITKCAQGKNRMFANTGTLFVCVCVCVLKFRGNAVPRRNYRYAQVQQRIYGR